MSGDTSNVSNTSSPLLFNKQESTNEGASSEKTSNALKQESKYVGCWVGMRGGRLTITPEKIRDLGSGEEAHYKELAITELQEKKGLQTGEEYLLEADEDFPKSFLAKIIRFSFNTDETVGIYTYDSYDDFLNNHFVGGGLFEKTECKRLQHIR